MQKVDHYWFQAYVARLWLAFTMYQSVLTLWNWYSDMMIDCCIWNVIGMVITSKGRPFYNIQVYLGWGIVAIGESACRIFSFNKLTWAVITHKVNGWLSNLLFNSLFHHYLLRHWIYHICSSYTSSHFIPYNNILYEKL